MKRALLLAIVGGVLLASLLGAAWIVSSGVITEPSVISNEETPQPPDEATVPTADILEFDYAGIDSELEGISNATVEETRDEADAIEGPPDEVRQAAEEGARDGISLAAERGVDVTEEQEQAAINSAVRAAAIHGDATPDSVRAAVRGASHGTLLQGQEREQARESDINATQVRASVYGSTVGVLTQHREANLTQLQSASYGAAHGTTAQYQHANVTQMQAAAIGASAGATHSAVQTQQSDGIQIQEAAQGGSYGALAHRQTANITQIQAAAFGAAGGGAEAINDRDTDSKKVQEAAMGAATGALLEGQNASGEQIQAVARGACNGALSQHQQASVVQVRSAARGASEGTLSQTQGHGEVDSVEQLQRTSERTAADTVHTAVDIDIDVEKTIYKYARGVGEDTDPNAAPELRSLFYDVDDETLFFGNPNEFPVTVAMTSEDGAVEAITLTPGETVTSEFDSGMYTLTAETEDDRTVKIAGSEEMTVNLGPDPESLTATVEGRTINVENPNDDHAAITVQEDGADVRTFDVSPTDEKPASLEPGAYTVSAQIDGSNVPINGEGSYEISIAPREIDLGVTIDEQEISIENPSDTNAIVRATHEETGDEQEITIPEATTESQTLDPGEYVLTGEADDRDVFLNGQEEAPISISQPGVTSPVRISNVTDPVEVGESLSVTAEISNDGNEESDGGITLDIDDREALDSATVTLEPDETETITLTYQTTEDDIGELDVTVRSSSHTAVETIEVLQESGDARQIDSCTVISEPGEYELVDDIEDGAESFDDELNACIRVTASDVVLEGDDNTVVGAGEEGTIGVLVAGTEESAAENVTIRNLQAESWDTGIQVGIEYDNRGDARLEDVTANGNGEDGIYVEYSDGVDIEAVEANRNGDSGIRAGEEGDVDSMVDITANENDVAGVVLDHASDLVAEDITVSENDGHGLLLGWRVYTSEFRDVTATSNDGDGLHLDTDVNGNEFSGITSSGNAGHGIYLGIAGGNVFRDSMIENNGDAGIRHIEDGSEYLNVTVRENEGGQVETRGWAPFTASELRIGDTAEFAVDEEPVSLDAVDRDRLTELPGDARAIGAGVEIDGIEDGVGAVFGYDEDTDEGQVELWHHDGEEWTVEETVDEPDGSIESTLTEDGIYAPVLIEEDDGQGSA